MGKKLIHAMVRFIAGLLLSFIFHTAFVWNYILIQELSFQAVNPYFYYTTILISFGLGTYLGKYIKLPHIPLHIYLLSDWGVKSYFREFIRPWKLSSLFLGILGLIGGSYIVNLPDWDVGISIVMALLTYIFSSWSLAVLLSALYLKKNRIASTLIFIFFYWLSVDGSYVLYNEIKGSMYFRLPNFLASSLLYFLCSIIWLYRGDLKSLNVFKV